MELPFDLVVTNTLEKPVSQDINHINVQLDATLRWVMQWLMRERLGNNTSAGVSNSGFLGDSLRCIPPGGSAMQVLVQPGTGFHGTNNLTPSIGAGNTVPITGLDDYAYYKPLSLAATQTATIDAAPSSGNERWDLIECVEQLNLTDTQSRAVWNGVAPPSGAFTPQNIPKTLSHDLGAALGGGGIPRVTGASTASISYKVGSVLPLGTNTKPTPTSGYVVLAYIYVPAGTTSIANANIQDVRRQLMPGGVSEIGLDVLTNNTSSSGFAAFVYGPPGVQLGASYGGTFAISTGAATYFDVYLAGLYYAQINAAVDLLLDSGGNGAAVYVKTVGSGAAASGDVTAMAACTPAINVPPTTNFIHWRIYVQGVNSGGASLVPDAVPGTTSTVRITGRVGNQ